MTINLRHRSSGFMHGYRLLVNEQCDTQFFMYEYLFIFLTLYMFRAHRAHHQERKIVPI